MYSQFIVVKKGGLYYPSEDFKKKAWAKDTSIYREAKKDPVKFWEKLASELKGPGLHQFAQMGIAYAQRAAQRLAYRQRRNVLQMDNWLEEALSFSGSNMQF